MKEYKFEIVRYPIQVCSLLNEHPEWNVVSITTKTETYPNCKPQTSYVIFYYIIE